LKVGDKIPDIKLKNEKGEEVSLPEIASKNKILCIFAYPKALTSGCTKQACGFRDNYDSLREKASIFGISSDSPVTQQKFITKHELPFSLLSDPKKELIAPLGAKKALSISRSHWIFVNGKLKSSHIRIAPDISVSTAKAEIDKIFSELK
ncbi:thioredoxin peroxidase DOT5 ASCRUDRAFT_33210, partial [Ascoidea rubescens DSM 1968]